MKTIYVFNLGNSTFFSFFFFAKCEVPQQIPKCMNYMEAFHLFIYSTHLYGTAEEGEAYYVKSILFSPLDISFTEISDPSSSNS